MKTKAPEPNIVSFTMENFGLVLNKLEKFRKDLDHELKSTEELLDIYSKVALSPNYVALESYRNAISRVMALVEKYDFPTDLR
jgi:hypothetical protein